MTTTDKAPMNKIEYDANNAQQIGQQLLFILLQTLNSLPTLLRTLFVEVFLPTFQ
jgi:hypothetical protein